MDLRTQDLSKEYTESLFSTIIDLSPMPVYVCAGKDMVVTVANQATLKAWGKDKSVIGKRFKDALPEMKDQPFLGLLLRVYSTGVPYQTDNDRADFLIDGAMRTFYFKFSYQPLKNGDGDIWGVLCIATDVTEFVLANRRAEESERRFKSLILKAPVSLCVLKGPSFIVDVANEGVLKIWGATEEQVSGKPIFEGLPEAKGQGLEELLNKVYTTGEAYTANEKQVDLPGPAGIETKVLNFVYSPYYEMDGNIAGVMAAAIDVTDQVMGRKSVEEVNKKLERTQQRLELALQAGRLGSYERVISSGSMVSSRQFKINFGYPVDAEVSFKDIMEAILPEYRVAARKVQIESLKEGTVYNIEFPIKWPDSSVHWIRVAGKSIRNEKGELMMSGITQDITEQRYLQQQKDDFIGIASHELKTPITSLKASLQLLNRIKKNPSSSMLPTLIDQANSSLNKVNYLVDDLLNATKMKEGQLELNKSQFVISEIIVECCQHIRAQGTYEIVTEGDLDLEVYADAHRLDQVLVNFVNNAVKYAPDSKIIKVNIEKIANAVKVSVTDEGPGIPKDKMDHLFDRYYRVDEKGQPYSGLGLGLYISSEIIKRHNGQIGVESELGKGSTFWFTIPL